MRALLVAPYVFVPPSWVPYFPQEPLALEYLRAASEGHQVHILDCVGHYPHQYRRLPDGRIQVGATVAQVQEVLDYAKPELVGVNFSFTTQAEPVREIVALAGANGITTVVGGSAAGFTDVGADMVVKGEGEATWRYILDNSGRNCHIPDSSGNFLPVDEILPPRRQSLWPYSMGLLNDTAPADKARILAAWLRYNRHNAGATLFTDRSRAPATHTSILTSRGCPFSCYFCATHNIWRRLWRPRSMRQVLGEVRNLYDRGVRTLNILDDSFNIQENRVRQFCFGILDAGMRLEISARSGLRPSHLSFDTLKLMRRAGFKDIWFGIESGNQRVLDNVIRKETGLLEVRQVLADCRAAGIRAGGYFVIGLPGERTGEMWDTITFAAEYCDRVRLYTCQPFPGSDLYADAVKNNWLVPGFNPSEALIFGSKTYLRTPEFDPLEVSIVAEAGKRLLKKRRKLDQR